MASKAVALTGASGGASAGGSRAPATLKVYDAKPAYIAAKTLTTQLRGFAFNKRLMLEKPDVFNELLAVFLRKQGVLKPG